MESEQLPASLEEVEQLILKLYTPGISPAVVASIQEALQCLQKAPAGWHVAQQLLDRPGGADDRVKFFGALTIIIKLNTESSSLSDDNAQELLQNLLRWLTLAAADASALLSLQKLCQALVTFYIHYSHLWPCCVRHVVLCLEAGRNLALDADLEAPNRPDMQTALLNPAVLRVATMFLNTLVIEVGKTDMSSPIYIGTHHGLIQNAQDVTDVLRSCLRLRGHEKRVLTGVQVEAIRGIQSWTLFAQRVSTGYDSLVAPLRTLVDDIIACAPDETLYTVAMEYLTDILSTYSGFFTEAHYQSIMLLFESEWAQQCYHALLKDTSDNDAILFGLFLIAFGDARVSRLMEDPSERHQKILHGLCGMLAGDGLLVGEDTIFVPTLEFWSTFAETMTDVVYSDAALPKEWLPLAMNMLMKVVGNCWTKIQYPPVETFVGWDRYEIEGFHDARKDVSDLLQTIYTLQGGPLVSNFVDLLDETISRKSWAEIESTAFCLAALSDCFSSEATHDDLLGRVFSTPLFDLLSLGEANLPVLLRQTALSLIERYAEYFERHSGYLPAALNLLFDAVASSQLAMVSSKSILQLSRSCAPLLTAEIGSFLTQYQNLHSNPILDPLAEERLVTAISYIIQAMPQDLDHRLQAFDQLLSFPKSDVEQCLRLLQGPIGTDHHNSSLFLKGRNQSLAEENLTPSGERDILLQIILQALRCLGGMARGMQAEAQSVDLETDVTTLLHSESRRVTDVQNDILILMASVRSAFPFSGEVVEAICTIFKLGFVEDEPGPFVFPPDKAASFFTALDHTTPRIGTAVSTACSFVSALSKGPRAHMAPNLAKLLPWVISLLQELPDPSDDIDLTQNGIEFVARVMSKHVEVFLQLRPASSLEFFFQFTLKVLDGKEPLPKQAAAEFWAAFLTLKSQVQETQAAITQAMGQLGPLFSQSLVRNIGGNASRSELDKLSEPLKRMVTQRAESQAWLARALNDEAFPSRRVSAADKDLFLKKIISLRGTRQTNQIVREFWLACRGSSFAYAS